MKESKRLFLIIASSISGSVKTSYTYMQQNTKHVGVRKKARAIL